MVQGSVLATVLNLSWKDCSHHVNATERAYWITELIKSYTETTAPEPLYRIFPEPLTTYPQAGKVST